MNVKNRSKRSKLLRSTKIDQNKTNFCRQIGPKMLQTTYEVLRND